MDKQNKPAQAVSPLPRRARAQQCRRTRLRLDAPMWIRGGSRMFLVSAHAAWHQSLQRRTTTSQLQSLAEGKFMANLKELPRRSAEEITVYKSLGHVVQDLSGAWSFYSQAEARYS